MHLEEDVSLLAALLEHIGLAKTAVYGREWGGVRGVRLSIVAPKRVRHVVLESVFGRMDEKEYVRRMKADPNFQTQEWTASGWTWFFDGAYPTDGGGGTNLKGFKAKASILYPFSSRGKHDPSGRSMMVKFSMHYG